jgi:MFS family permease
MRRRARRMFYGWYVVGCAFVTATCGFGLGFYGPGVYLASLHTLRGWPITTMSWAVTLYYLASATWIIFVGDAIERFGARCVLLIGAGAMSAAVAYLPAVRSPWQLYPTFVVMSLGWAAMSGAAINTIVAPWFDRKRGLAISLALNGSSCGGVFVPPLLVALTTKLGFEKGLHVAVVLMLAVMAPVLLVLRRRPEDVGLGPDGRRLPGQSLATGPSRPDRPDRWSRRGAWRDRAFLTVSIPFALGLLAQVGFLTHQMSYLLRFLPAESASLVVSATAAAAVLGRTGTGLFVDRVDRRVMSAGNFALQMVALGLLLGARSTAIVCLGCVLFGLGVGNMITLPSLIIQREFPRQHFARIVSLVVSVNQYTFAFGPAILGGLRDLWGNYSASFVFCIGLQTIAVLVVLRGRRGTAGGSTNVIAEVTA